MQELERMISIYHTLFLIFLIVGIVLLIVSVILFFYFDIRRIFDMKTGRAQKRTIQKMEEINAQTGKLRQDMVANTPPQLKGEDRITYPVTAANPTTPNPAVQKQGQQPPQQRQEMQDSGRTEQLNSNAFQETSLLGMDTNETTVLSGGANGINAENTDYGETTLLSQNPQQLQPQIQLPGYFKIEKEIVWIHTQEII